MTLNVISNLSFFDQWFINGPLSLHLLNSTLLAFAMHWILYRVLGRYTRGPRARGGCIYPSYALLPPQLPCIATFWLSLVELVPVSFYSDMFSHVLCFFLTWAHSVTSEVTLSSEAAIRVNNTLKHLEQLFGIKCSIDFSYYRYLSIP